MQSTKDDWKEPLTDEEIAKLRRKFESAGDPEKIKFTAQKAALLPDALNVFKL